MRVITLQIILWPFSQFSSSGTFARVSLCRQKTSSKFFALKIISLQDTIRLKQVHFLKQINISLYAEIHRLTNEWKDHQCQSVNFLVASRHKLASDHRWQSFWIVFKSHVHLTCSQFVQWNSANVALLSKCMNIEHYHHQLCVYLAGWAREKRKIYPQGKFWHFTQERPVKMPRWLGNAHPNWCCRPPNKMMVSLLVFVVLIRRARCSNELLLVTLELERLLVGF